MGYEIIYLEDLPQFLNGILIDDKIVIVHNKGSVLALNLDKDKLKPTD